MDTGYANRFLDCKQAIGYFYNDTSNGLAGSVRILNRQQTFLAALAVVLLALFLRIHHLGFESLFMDELRQVSYYPRSLTEIFHLAASQQQPPLDYWIGHFFAGISNSDFIVRLPAALFGTGAVAVLMLLAARLTSWPVALPLGVVMAAMPFPIYYSQDARPYSIAIFFVLLVLWCLDRYLHCTRFRHAWLFVFFGAVLGLLLSRALSPLVFTVSLLGISSLFYILHRLGGYEPDGAIGGRLPAAIGAMIAALVIYVPVFLNILNKGQRYMNSHSGLGADFLAKGIHNFDVVPLWQAYVAQLEPINWFALPLLLAGPIFVFRYKALRRDLLVIFICCLLPITALLHLFVFQAKTDWPFRPPYPVYLLPLCLLIAAVSVNQLFHLLKSRIPGRSRLIVALFGIAVSVVLVTTLIDFKTWPKRTDWKGLAQALAHDYGPETLLIFDGLLPPQDWKPTFYGFPRYYKGRSAMISADRIPAHVRDLADRTYKPVLIWFYYRDYFLTRRSVYPVMPAFHPTADFSRILTDSSLRTHRFTGFLVVELKTPTGNGLADLSRLLDFVLKDIGPSDQVIDLYLAAAAVHKVRGLRDWNEYLETARALAPKAVEGKVRHTIKLIAGGI